MHWYLKYRWRRFLSKHPDRVSRLNHELDRYRDHIHNVETRAATTRARLLVDARRAGVDLSLLED